MCLFTQKGPERSCVIIRKRAISEKIHAGAMNTLGQLTILPGRSFTTLKEKMDTDSLHKARKRTAFNHQREDAPACFLSSVSRVLSVWTQQMPEVCNVCSNWCSGGSVLSPWSRLLPLFFFRLSPLAITTW